MVTCPVTIVSYDLMAKLAYDFRACNFQVVIADESHYLKNGESKRSMAMVGIMRQAKRAIMLTGTPALARPIELFNLLNCLDPTLFPNYLEYAKRYCAAHQGAFGLDCSGASNLEELHLVLQERGTTSLSACNACSPVTLHPVRTGTHHGCTPAHRDGTVTDRLSPVTHVNPSLSIGDSDDPPAQEGCAVAAAAQAASAHHALYACQAGRAIQGSD